MPRRKKRKDGRTTVSLSDELHKDLRSAAFFRRLTLAELLDEIVAEYFERLRSFSGGEVHADPGVDLYG